MKKILMTLAAVAVATTMNAQIWAGGELGFTTSHKNSSNWTSKNLTISPEVGYNLSDNFAVAIALGYSYASNLKDEDLNMEFDHTNTYSIKPYVRYTFVKAGNFSAFLDGGLNYQTQHAKGYKKNMNTIGVFVTPGIAYNVSEKVTLVAHLGDGLYYNHKWNDSYIPELGSNEKYAVQTSNNWNKFGFQLLNGISFGAYYNF